MKCCVCGKEIIYRYITVGAGYVCVDCAGKTTVDEAVTRLGFGYMGENPIDIVYEETDVEKYNVDDAIADLFGDTEKSDVPTADEVKKYLDEKSQLASVYGIMLTDSVNPDDI